MLLHFGIPSLDRLIESQKDDATALSASAESISILGPDGAGKSVLALHLASRYAADCERLLRHEKQKDGAAQTLVGERKLIALDPADLPRILYISSDLKHPSAQKIWKTFELNKPNTRHIPFDRTLDALRRYDSYTESNQTELKLIPFAPSETEELVNYFLALKQNGEKAKYDKDFKPQIAFLDLAAHTAGDDWKFVNTLLVKLQSIASGKVTVKVDEKEDKKEEKLPLPHLVIIDSVEGFETFVGKLDSYGVEQSRRARVAQCVRNADERVHLVFVVEEPNSSEHLAEEYVTDVVLRLRKRAVAGPTVLSVEVQKARSREHAKGEHPFEIRHKSGTSTGSWENVDTPNIKNAYVQVFTSLAHRSHLMSAERVYPPSGVTGKVAKFGLPYLDRLLWSPEYANDKERRRADEDNMPVEQWFQPPERGLRTGTATALIGDPSTGKSILGERFLAEGFKGLIPEFVALYALQHKFIDLSKYNVQDMAGNQGGANFVFRQFMRVLQKLASSIYMTESPHNDPAEPETGADGKPVSWDLAWNEVWNAVDKGLAGEPDSQVKEALRRLLSSEGGLDWLNTVGVMQAAELVGRQKTKKRLVKFADEYPLTPTDRELLNNWEKRLAASKNSASEGASTQALDASQSSQQNRSDGLSPLRSRSYLPLPWADESNDLPALRDIFRHPNLVAPSVLLTTRDRRGDDVSRRCVDLLSNEINRCMALAAPTDEKKKLEWIKSTDELKKELAALIEYQLIVRRFDMQALPESAIFHLVHRNLLQAIIMIFGVGLPPLNDERFRKAGRIRLVIDDIRVLTRVNPEITADGAFLPFLSFFLQREGVVSLFIHTDNVRPNSAPNEEISRALLSIVKHAILTWNAPFEGRNRVAISVMPHSEPANNGVVRELTLDHERPFVTRRFELYSGIEEGKPVPVPLTVYLFEETSPFAAYAYEEDLLFREVFTPVRSESPANPGPVIFAIPQQRYQALRDFTQLSLDSQDSHTMVFQVDEHWAVSDNHVLENLQEYIDGELPEMQPSGPASQGRPNESSHEDPFQLFRSRPRTGMEPKGAKQGRYRRRDYFVNSNYNIDDLDRPVPIQPGTPPKPAPPAVDEGQPSQSDHRIPFMWDFGFLLARRGLYEMAKDQLLLGIKKDEEPDTIESPTAMEEIRDTVPVNGDTVGTILELMMRSPDEKKPVVSWRKFLGACTQIAEVHYRQTGTAALPFDVAYPSVETLNALVLEMWFSEMLTEGSLRFALRKQKLKAAIRSTSLADLLTMTDRTDLTTSQRGKSGSGSETRLGKFGSIQETFKSFKECWGKPKDCNWECRLGKFNSLPLGAFCLYKVWLLLLESLDFDQFTNPDDPFTFQLERNQNFNAVASRHWYKTACYFSKELYKSEGIHDSLIALRMPGHFSTRGDWFLGTPKSSRSKLLAQHAIDLLSSRRANLARMQRGLGLPVRDIVEDNACMWFSTALHCAVSPKTREDTLRNGDDGANGSEVHGEGEEDEIFSTELKYGELTSLGARFEDKSDRFWWLWRSRIHDYDRMCRPLQKWIVRLFHWTRDYRKRKARNWKGGFTAYDELTRKRFDEANKYDSFVEFGHLCDVLLAELRSASLED